MLPHEFDEQLLELGTELQQEIFRSYMNRADKAVVVLREDLTIRAVNEYGCEMLGKRPEQLQGARWVGEFVEPVRRDDALVGYWTLLQERSQKPVRNELAVETTKGTIVLSWQHFLVQGTGRQTLAILSVGEDVTAQKQMEQTLQRRNAILEALSLAADHFLTATPDVWEGNVLKVLEQLGRARGSERVYTCKNRTLDDGRVATFLKYEWKRSGETHVFQGADETYQVYDEAGLSRWKELFSQGEVICEEVEQLPSQERSWNVAAETRSVVMVPVFVQEEWWGYLAFEDWAPDRECAPAELEALKAVALTFGQAIRRKRIEEELQQEKQNVEDKVTERTRELEAAKQEIQAGLWRQQEEKARLTASIHSLSLGFVLTDLDRQVILVNHAVADILGESPEGWNWETLRERLNESIDLERQFLICTQEQRELVVDEVVYGEKYLRFYLTPIKLVEGDGRVIGVVMLIDDITEEKQLQKSRDEFFAVASHELRTPLSAIRGNAATIKDYFSEHIPDEPLAMLDDIYASSVRLIDMVNEYLDISRLELSKVELKKSRFNLVPIINTVMEEMEANAREKGIGWFFDRPDGEVWVHADPQRTEQVLFNLMGNALKFTKHGEVRVWVEQGEGTVRVPVRDSGQGIPPEEQGMLFEKFKQVGDRVYTRDASAGTGMGLYISRLIVEAMGGVYTCNRVKQAKDQRLYLSCQTVNKTSLCCIVYVKEWLYGQDIDHRRRCGDDPDV
jgi:two-component system, sensor histidine kinase and response regulator